MSGRVQLGGADLVEGWGRDEEDLGVVSGDVGVCDDARQVPRVFLERDALGVDFLVKGCVIGAEEDNLGSISGSYWKDGCVDRVGRCDK